LLEKINARLKEDGIRVRIEQRATNFSLRATLPLKAGPGKKQQRIPLSTQELFQADQEARKLHGQIKEGQFCWQDWEIAEDIATPGITCGDFRKSARKLYLQRFNTETSWTKKWKPALAKLPPDDFPCDQTVLRRCIELMKFGSAGRRDQGNILAQIARTVSFDYEELQDIARGYTASAITPRDIPKDDDIEALAKKIRAPHWAWMYSMCATYGLRPHEIVECEITSDGNCEVGDETKTGFHIAWPCNERWVETFNLRKVHRPQQCVVTVTKAANLYLHTRGPIPFPLYNLRHAYAIRLLMKGVPVELGAQLMGHSLEVHSRTYHRWIQAGQITKLRKRFDLT
jgi:hypothetical protein